MADVSSTRGRLWPGEADRLAFTAPDEQPLAPTLFSWPALGLEDVEDLARWLRETVSGIRRQESATNLARYLVGIGSGPRGPAKLKDVADRAGLSNDQVNNLLQPRKPPWEAEGLRQEALEAVLPDRVDGFVIEQYPVVFGRYEFDLFSAHAFWQGRTQLLIVRRALRQVRKRSGVEQPLDERLAAGMAAAEESALSVVRDEVARIRADHNLSAPTIALQPWIGELLRVELFLSGHEYLIAVDASFREHGLDPVDFGIEDRLPGFGRGIAVHMVSAPRDASGISVRELGWRPRLKDTPHAIEHGVCLLQEEVRRYFVARPLDDAHAGPSYRASRLEERSRRLVRAWSVSPLSRLARRYGLDRLHIADDEAFERHAAALVSLSAFCARPRRDEGACP
jgi:hypothetical protein